MEPRAPTVNPLWYTIPRVANSDTFSAGGSITTDRQVNPWQGAAGGQFNIYTGVYDYVSGLNTSLGAGADSPLLSNQDLQKYGYDWGYYGLDRQQNKLGGYQSQEVDDFVIGNADQLLKFGVFPSAGRGVSMVGLPETPAPKGMESALKVAGSFKWQADLQPKVADTNNLPISKIPYNRQVNRNSSINFSRIR